MNGHGYAYHNTTEDDDRHWSNSQIHLEMRQRFTEPAATEGRVTGTVTWVSVCPKCGLVSLKHEGTCLCGSWTYLKSYTVADG